VYLLHSYLIVIIFQEYKEIYGSMFGKPGIQFIVSSCKPKSRGWVKLRSADYRDTPRINTKIFDHPDDMKIMIGGLYQLRLPINSSNFV